MLQPYRTFNTLLTLALLLAPLQVESSPFKQTIVHPGYVFDDFSKVDIRLPGGDGNNGNGNDPYWWAINNGDGGQVYAECADATCITGEKEQSLKYARLQLLHDATPAVWDGTEYNGTEISEYRTMVSSGLPGRWFPTEGHPVTVSARVRFSANYAQDGGGGAVGSTGLWLWNSYPDPLGYAPIQAFGFNWAEIGSAGIYGGLQATALQDSFPIYSQPVAAPIRLSDWHTWSFTWSADAAGSQSIAWELDGSPAGQSDLAVPYPALSMTLWSDNQFPTFLEGGEYTVVMHNPVAPQDFDIDWVEIDQPQ